MVHAARASDFGDVFQTWCSPLSGDVKGVFTIRPRRERQIERWRAVPRTIHFEDERVVLRMVVAVSREHVEHHPAKHSVHLELIPGEGTCRFEQRDVAHAREPKFRLQ